MNIIGQKNKKRRKRSFYSNRRRIRPGRTLILRRGITRDKLSEALDKIAQMDVAVRKSNMQCKVPTTARHPIHSPKMNNSHVIGRRWIERTRQGKTALLSWRTSPRHLAELIADTVTNIGQEPLPLGPMLLPELNRFRPRKTPDEQCKYTVACQSHDGPAYPKADDPASDLNDPELHLELALRAISSFVAWDEGCKLYASGAIGRALLSNRSLRQIPELRTVALDAYYRARRTTIQEQTLAGELEEWQELYRTSNYRAVATARATAEANIAMTGCGLWGQSLGEHVIATVLTSGTGHPSGTTPTEIILSCRKSQSSLARLLQPLVLRLKARALARKVGNNKSIDVIIALASEWEFFYVADKDYRTRLEPFETQHIEEQLAKDKLGYLTNPPADIHADNPPPSAISAAVPTDGKRNPGIRTT